MPLYEFTCRKCGHNFEELMTLAEVQSNAVKCPACNSKRVEKGFSAFATNADSSTGFGSGGCGGGGGFT